MEYLMRNKTPSQHLFVNSNSFTSFINFLQNPTSICSGSHSSLFILFFSSPAIWSLSSFWPLSVYFRAIHRYRFFWDDLACLCVFLTFLSLGPSLSSNKAIPQSQVVHVHTRVLTDVWNRTNSGKKMLLKVPLVSGLIGDGSKGSPGGC